MADLRTDGSDGGAAFPRQDDITYSSEVGMSLRDYFAIHAPEMTDQWWSDSPRGQHWIDARSAWNYAYADAMLAQRDK